MELNERNFLINEYSKHRRKTRLPAPVFKNITSTIQNEFEILTVTEDMKLGLNGFRLGTLKEIFSRHTECPFCGLIIESLTEQPRKLVTAGDRQANPTHRERRQPLARTRPCLLCKLASRWESSQLRFKWEYLWVTSMYTPDPFALELARISRHACCSDGERDPGISRTVFGPHNQQRVDWS